MCLILLAILAGMVLPMQAGINSTLAKYLHSTAQAAFISFVVGLGCMIIFCLMSRQNLPSIKQLMVAPPYILIGGFLGAVMVMTTTTLAPRIGAVALVSSLLAGQMICSVILDHNGFFGYPIHPANIMRIVGIMFLISGVFIINRF